VIRAGWRATTPSARSGGCETFIYGFVGVERRGGFPSRIVAWNEIRSGVSSDSSRISNDSSKRWETCGTGNSSTFRKQVSPPPDSMSILPIAATSSSCRPTCRDSKATISTFGSRATRYTVPPSTNERSTMRTSTTCRANARDGPCTGPSDSRNRSTKTPSRRRARTASSRSPYPRRNRPLSREQRSTSRRGVDVTFRPLRRLVSRGRSAAPRDRVRRGARCGHRRGYRHP